MLRQEAHLSHRGRATLRVVENLAVTQGRSKPFEITPLGRPWVYLAPFLRYSTSNNGVLLKSGLGVIQGHWNWHHLIDHYDLLLICHCKYSSILYHFRVI